MQVDVTASSRHNYLVLYDPGAIGLDVPVDPDLSAQEPKPLPVMAIQELAARGYALFINIPGEDCEARLRVFVAEDAAEKMRQRAISILRGATLRIPDGAVKADGVEFIARAGQVRAHSEAESIQVPPGDYDVEVLQLFSWKIAHRADEIRLWTRPGDRAVHRAITAYTWIGILLLPANLFLAPLAVALGWRSRGLRGAMTVLGVVLLIDALVLAGFHLLQRARRDFQRLGRVGEVDAQFERDNPDIVVVLRPGVAGSDPRVPALARVEITP